MVLLLSEIKRLSTIVTSSVSSRQLSILQFITVGQFLINNCILGKSGQIVNPVIVKVDPVPYYSIRAHLFVNLLIANLGKLAIHK